MSFYEANKQKTQHFTINQRHVKQVKRCNIKQVNKTEDIFARGQEVVVQGWVCFFFSSSVCDLNWQLLCFLSCLHCSSDNSRIYYTVLWEQLWNQEKQKCWNSLLRFCNFYFATTRLPLPTLCPCHGLSIPSIKLYKSATIPLWCGFFLAT